MKIALVVNPIAGIGGPAGLAGSDGEEIQTLAKQRGSRSHASSKASEFLELLQNTSISLTITGPGKMGFDQATAMNWTPAHVVEIGSHLPPIGEPAPASMAFGNNRPTTPADTKTVVREAVQHQVDLVVFVGGDGTARDVADAMGEHNDIPMLGIPAGVKMHSSVFALSPAVAARVVNTWKPSDGTVSAEIADIDEAARREDRVAATLYGRCKVPRQKESLQGGKVGSPNRARGSTEGLARALASELNPNAAWVFGPGSTMAAIATTLGLDTSLLGVDLFLPGHPPIDREPHLNLSDRDLEHYSKNYKIQIALSPIGGQGFLLGRGNQQIGHSLLKRISKNDLFVLATQEKIAKLMGSPLLIDIGDQILENKLSGYMRIINGPNDYSMIETRSASIRN